jgi:hypothetical protein
MAKQKSSLKLLHKFPIDPILYPKRKTSRHLKPLFPQNTLLVTKIKNQQILSTRVKGL